MDDPKPYIPHYEVLRLIGEIDGVSMDSECSVFLHMKGKKIKVLVDDGTEGNLYIDRAGLSQCLLKQLIR
jgi:hypothetical protein